MNEEIKMLFPIFQYLLAYLVYFLVTRMRPSP